MIEELINKIIEKLKASEPLRGIYWHYGEPVQFTRSAEGEGYVTLVPLEQQTVEPLMYGDRHYLHLFIVVTYRHADEEVCDKWVHNKTEEIWKVLIANENWEGLVSESHLENYTFFPSIDADYSFDKMFSRLAVRTEIYPEE